MRTFLTGAGAYIGLHILRELLEARHQVTAVVHIRHLAWTLAGQDTDQP